MWSGECSIIMLTFSVILQLSPNKGRLNKSYWISWRTVTWLEPLAPTVLCLQELPHPLPPSSASCTQALNRPISSVVLALQLAPRLCSMEEQLGTKPSRLRIMMNSVLLTHLVLERRDSSLVPTSHWMYLKWLGLRKCTKKAIARATKQRQLHC